MKELTQLEQNPTYIECVEKIKSLQKPIVDNLEHKLTASLKTFMPNIKDVKLDNNYQLYNFDFISRKSNSRVPINIDDGNLTSLDDRGDGVKSLTAISIVQSMSFEKADGRALILCIEEPEAHLHPDAIHSLRNIILEIAQKEGLQVIITTHSPLLADRNCVSNNVVVYDNHRIKCCEAISEVREVLGVRNTDNIVTKKVVLTEGESDKRYLIALCKALDDDLKNKLASGDLEIVNVHSSTKMDYQIRLYNSQMISSMVLLDSDDSGLESQKQLVNSKTKLSNEILMIKSVGMNKCELEDVVSFDEYFDLVREKYNIELDNKDFKKRDKPWSDRLKRAAKRSPGVFDDTVEASIKETLADIVCEKNMNAIALYDRDYIKSLINAIKIFAQ
jgi:predicted ATP-dependent endonuclease of OLD family